MSTECSLCTLRNNLIFETQHWTVILNIDQNYLGRLLVISTRHIGNLSMLTLEEWDDLHRVIQKSEKTLQKAFPEINLFNWGCMMNHAFKEKPYNPHVHWHVKPRHDTPISFEGVTWTDTEFGKHYTTCNHNIIPDEALQKMRTHILNQL